MILRWYQQEALDKIFEHLAHKQNNPCVVLPTGSGKTPLLAAVCRDALAAHPTVRILIVSHVKELLEQSAEKLVIMLPDKKSEIGIYSAGLNSRDTDKKIIVGGIQSIYKRACDLGKFNLIIIDEAHLIPPSGDGMYRQFIADAQVINPRVRVLGLTATPFRMTSGVICSEENILNEVIYEVGIKELIAHGYLCNLRTRAGSIHPDLTNVTIRGGEFVESEMQAVFDQDFLITEACREIIALTENRKSVLIFSAGVEHGKHITEKIPGAMFLCGETPAGERFDIIEKFKRQELKYLVNVNVLTTGFDAPNVDAIALLRATLSPGLYYQMIGRGLRIADRKKDCMVLDYGENALRHGPIDLLSETIKNRNAKKGKAPTRECKNCHEILSCGYKTCPYCGYEFPVEENQDKIVHGFRADGSPILSGEIIEQEIEIDDVEYHLHEKQKQPDAPKTLRVEYYGYGNMREPVKEWICFGHSGFARARACDWWRARTNLPVPPSAEIALEMINAGAINDPSQIKTRLIAGEKFCRVIEVKIDKVIFSDEVIGQTLEEFRRDLVVNVKDEKSELQKEFADFFGIEQVPF